MGKRLIPTSATAVISGNRKLGAAAATYASQESCPIDPAVSSVVCRFHKNGCYFEYGLTGYQARLLNAGAKLLGHTPLQIAGIEASKIDALPGKPLPLRLHVGGDCTTNQIARIVSGAADRWTKRTGKPSWTYTHAWCDVDRASWGSVNVLASCETAEEVEQAMARGYAAAIVVPEHPSRKSYWLDNVSDITVIPCPQESRPEITCASCGLCQRSGWLLRMRRVIGFAIHSGGVKKARAALARKN